MLHEDGKKRPQLPYINSLSVDIVALEKGFNEEDGSRKQWVLLLEKGTGSTENPPNLSWSQQIKPPATKLKVISSVWSEN